MWDSTSVGEENETFFIRICPSDVSARRLSPEGDGHETVCQQGRWALKGGGLEGPTSIGEGNECQRGRRVLKRSGLWDPTSIGEEKNEEFFIRTWKPLPSRCILKTLRESPKKTVFASDRLGPLQNHNQGKTTNGKQWPLDSVTNVNPPMDY